MIYKLYDAIGSIAHDIHLYHGNGHQEKVYENALRNRLIKSGWSVQQQYPITVFDEDGSVIGTYFSDLFAENFLIIEIKAVKAIAPEHETQVMGYLKSGRIEHGLLINFGSYKLEIRKFAVSNSLSLMQSMR